MLAYLNEVNEGIGVRYLEEGNSERSDGMRDGLLLATTQFSILAELINDGEFDADGEEHGGGP